MSAPVTDEVLTIEELGQRLKLSANAIRDLHRDAGLPIWRLTPRGAFFAYWSEVNAWIKKHRRKHANGAK